ncbi:MAG: hypothetical protein R3F19_29690 [Verrucomicrobiales bacterium]
MSENVKIPSKVAPTTSQKYTFQDRLGIFIVSIGIFICLSIVRFGVVRLDAVFGLALLVLVVVGCSILVICSSLLPVLKILRSIPQIPTLHPSCGNMTFIYSIAILTAVVTTFFYFLFELRLQYSPPVTTTSDFQVVFVYRGAHTLAAVWVVAVGAFNCRRINQQSAALPNEPANNILGLFAGFFIAIFLLCVLVALASVYISREEVDHFMQTLFK